MSNTRRNKRTFQYGLRFDSWCTRCSGLRCEEDVRFTFDERGSVQGYIIDPKKLGEAEPQRHQRADGRMRDSSPGDGIYKRSRDVRKLMSRDPARVNSVRFSHDILKYLLLGTEGCDDFLKGHRSMPLKGLSDSKEHINLNGAAADVLSGKRRTAHIELVRGTEDVCRRNPGTNPLTRGY